MLKPYLLNLPFFRVPDIQIFKQLPQEVPSYGTKPNHKLLSTPGLKKGRFNKYSFKMYNACCS